MKSLIRLSILFILPVFIACNSGADKGPNADDQKAETSLQDVKKEMKEVQVKTGTYLTQEYQEMVKEVNAYAMSTEAELNELGKDLEGEYKEQRNEAVTLKDSLTMYLNEVQQEGAEDVDIIIEKIKNTRSALEKSMNTFKEAMKEENNNKKNK